MNRQETPLGIMPSHWRISKVREEALQVTDFVANGSFASLRENVAYKDTEDYAVLIRQVDYNNHFSGPFVFVDKHAYDFLAKSQLHGGEIIISNVGNVGIVFRCPKLKYHMALAPNVIMVKFKGDDGFYHYWFRSPLGQQSLHAIESGSAQPKFNKTSFKDLCIPVPPIEEQRKIAAVLGALDDKIENNRKICANLEAQAQAIFKSWFVDFEPFGGKMPSGWDVLPLESVCFNIRDRVGSEGVKERKVLSAIADGELVLSEEFFTKQVYSKDIAKYIIVNEGDFAYNPARINIGSIGINDLGVKGCVSPVYVAIRVDKEYRNFFKLFFKTPYFAEEVKRRAIGSVRQLLSYSDFGMISCVYPAREYIQKFNRIYEVILSGQRAAEKESRVLAAMRDALLPKLMSGEIDVEKVKVA